MLLIMHNSHMNSNLEELAGDRKINAATVFDILEAGELLVRRVEDDEPLLLGLSSDLVPVISFLLQGSEQNHFLLEESVALLGLLPNTRTLRIDEVSAFLEGVEQESPAPNQTSEVPSSSDEVSEAFDGDDHETSN